MSAVLVVLGWVLLALLGAVLVALALPVWLRLDAQAKPDAQLKVGARLLAGLTPQLTFYDSTQPKEEAEEEEPAPKPRKGRGDWAKRGPRMAAAAPGLLAGLLRPVRFHRLHVDADVGLSDPAGTGQLYGLLAPVIYALPRSPSVSIAVRPDFDGPRLEGEVAASLRVIPLAWVPPLARFGWRVFASGR